MKTVYNNIELKPGVHTGGICKIEIVPIEWLDEKIETDFSTGAVVEVNLIAGKEWIVLELAPDSYLFDERSKTSKAGSYYELAISGQANDLDDELRQLLETLRYHQFVVKATDREKRPRISGNIDKGMKMSIPNANDNADGGGTLSVALNFSFEHERMAPFIITPCQGITNWDKIEILKDDGIPPSFMSINFFDGSTTGTTEVEIINDPGDTHNLTLASGESVITGDAAFWADYLESETITIRWRRKCRGVFNTAWASDTFLNPFY